MSHVFKELTDSQSEYQERSQRAAQKEIADSQAHITKSVESITEHLEDQLAVQAQLLGAIKEKLEKKDGVAPKKSSEN
jgi:hypothetical protein